MGFGVFRFGVLWFFKNFRVVGVEDVVDDDAVVMQDQNRECCKTLALPTFFLLILLLILRPVFQSIEVRC